MEHTPPNRRSLPARILITDGEQHAALAATRSLGKAGHEVFVTSASRLSFAALSRYASRSFIVPDALHQPAAFADAVRELCVRERIDLLLPITDASLLALLPVRDTIAAPIPWPALSSVERTADKQEVQRLAATLGISVPMQRLIESTAAAASFDALSIRYPVVIKPSRSVRGGKHFRVVHAADAAQLRARLAKLSGYAFPVMLQERIVGPGTGVFLLRWKGRTIAQFAHRRVRENPPAGGASTCCESIEADPALVEVSERLLELLDWSGVAMIEYKRCSATGEAFIMEINGRFWGSLQLAVDAGVDFPRLLVQLALGEEPPPQPAYRLGVRLRSLLRDADHLIARLRWSPAELDLPPETRRRSRVFRNFLTWGRSERVEIFRFDDPLPVMREILNFIRRRS